MKSLSRAHRAIRKNKGKGVEPHPLAENEKKKKKKKVSRKVKIIRWGLAVFFLAVFYFCVNFFLVFHAAKYDDVKDSTRVDAIVVLGAAQYNGTPSPVLRARLDHALDLYRKGIAPIIIVTGGNQEGDVTTEAAASANYLLNRGVPDTNILREVQGKSTYDSLRDTAVFTKERGIKKVVLVTDGYHVKRAELIAGEVGLDAIGSPTPHSPVSGFSEIKNMFSESARISAGRIIGFRRVSRDSTLSHFVP